MNCVIQAQQFFFQQGKGVEEFDIEVADTAEDLIVWVVGDMVFDAGFPFALGG